MPGKRETIYDTEKLAKFFGVTKQTVQDWCKRGKLPAFKIGKEWKIRVADLRKVIDQKVRVNKKERTPGLFS